MLKTKLFTAFLSKCPPTITNACCQQGNILQMKSTDVNEILYLNGNFGRRCPAGIKRPPLAAKIETKLNTIKMKTTYSLIPGEKTQAIFNLLELANNEIHILNKNILNKIKPRISKDRIEFLKKNIIILNRDLLFHLRNENTGLFENMIEFDRIEYMAKIPVKKMEKYGEISTILELDSGKEYLIDYEKKAHSIEIPQFYNSEKRKNTVEIYGNLINSHPKTTHIAYDLYEGVFKLSNRNDFFSGEVVEIGELGVLVGSEMYDSVINLAHKNRILSGEYMAPYYCFIFRNFVVDHYEITTIRLIRGTEDQMVFSTALSLVANPNIRLTLKKGKTNIPYSYEFNLGTTKINIEEIYPKPFDKTESESENRYLSRRRKYYGELKIKLGFI
jgi:hypothetical protein